MLTLRNYPELIVGASPMWNNENEKKHARKGSKEPLVIYDKHVHGWICSVCLRDHMFYHYKCQFCRWPENGIVEGKMEKNKKQRKS